MSNALGGSVCDAFLQKTGEELVFVMFMYTHHLHSMKAWNVCERKHFCCFNVSKSDRIHFVMAFLTKWQELA